ncbi:lymphocyte antigen 86 isoform X2 [Thamnophis elegans]|uniref:lymphocyte antigen 86 isoform X2 n=1 Tax=Thamnophis elegans TaxID=35005 RepID=UPI0013776553|nr:lymphocyte antigen 86 isoform X2 [Thamnophis elegans]
MKALKVVPVLLSLIYINASITRWPTHIICKNNNLEVNYRSCDPLQDIALSVDSCTYIAGRDVTIRLATVLRHAINELYVDFSFTINGQIVPLYNKQVCERNQPQFQFCGKKKGEYIYYAGPVSLNMENIPQPSRNYAVAA